MFSSPFSHVDRKHQGSPPSSTVSCGCIEGPSTSTSLPSACPKKKHRSVRVGAGWGPRQKAPEEVRTPWDWLLAVLDTKGAGRAHSGGKEAQFAGNLPGTSSSYPADALREQPACVSIICQRGKSFLPECLWVHVFFQVSLHTVCSPRISFFEWPGLSSAGVFILKPFLFLNPFMSNSVIPELTSFKIAI